ncbi:antifreeze protein [Pseudorhodobacter sp.]|uniref:antifreeze protein n=1 Tax=Pseudorhodobacter sp. TaxID=1934400 RepID=UPI002648AB32|nr:antifreeze protein [Pseudorhodobacter sp.]MDN5786294.1 antifreeze protein [Pseudorhodobacter sp.]
MFPPRLTSDMLRLSVEMGMMMAEAQMVIVMRMMGMAGVWNVTKGENKRMVSEKTTALIASGFAAQKAIAAGADPTGAALAAMRPLRSKTRANARRLSGRGPKSPV